jgi:hypothetical protein
MGLGTHSLSQCSQLLARVGGSAADVCLTGRNLRYAVPTSGPSLSHHRDRRPGMLAAVGSSMLSTATSSYLPYAHAGLRLYLTVLNKVPYLTYSTPAFETGYRPDPQPPFAAEWSAVCVAHCRGAGHDVPSGVNRSYYLIIPRELSGNEATGRAERQKHLAPTILVPRMHHSLPIHGALDKV